MSGDSDGAPAAGAARAAGEERRTRLAGARIQLVFTPEVCGASSAVCDDSAAREALARLAAALPHVDAVQVRPKPLGAGTAISEARAARDWTRAVLARVAEAAPGPSPSAACDPNSEGGGRPLVLVNDRVDVAKCLAPEGCDGVHVGQQDAPPALARAFLGPDLLVGLSTHTLREVAAAAELPLEARVDYLGFGPTFATDTKGYARGLGAEAAWIARQAACVPLFAIGGIGPGNAADLAAVGRIAVSAAILTAGDPARAARELRALLDVDA